MARGRSKSLLIGLLLPLGSALLQPRVQAPTRRLLVAARDQRQPKSSRRAVLRRGVLGGAVLPLLAPSAARSEALSTEAEELLKLGRLEESRGNLEKATKYYSKLTVAAPDFPYAFANRANGKMSQGGEKRLYLQLHL